MWNQRDQIQAYQFLRRRLVSALVSADANHPASPSMRVVLGTVIGLVVVLLTTAVFGIIGLLTPSRAEEWRQGGQVIVEKETGARFILGADNALHPVLNYASARLLAGGDGDRTVVVPASTLSGVPRGPGMGISGAPDSLPGVDHLLTGPWTRCTRLAADRPAGDDPISTVLIGQEPGGAELGPAQAILATLRSGELFLITDGQRHRLVDEHAVVALGYAAAERIPVAPAWLNTIPAGRDLDTIDVPGRGESGPRVGATATRVGQVLVTGTAEHYLVRADGLAVVTETEARLVLGSPGSAAAYPDTAPRALPVSAADVADAPRSAAREDGYPQRRPELIDIDATATVCASGDRVTVGTGLPGNVAPRTVDASAAGAGGADPAEQTGTGPAATEVHVPGGAGAVVAEQTAPGAPPGPVYVITDTGVRYPVPGEDALRALGYGTVSRTEVPAAVLSLFPTGPALDPATARTTTSS
ncbi:type VII secretion protein EccB [Goodfellowiella coeruleoviolacea]|uniref:Type VII secretion protein EccB n=1 Tax=Goodfellowiella coeruleoviolacea TaxID=334858 RepID=A0AAE3GKZ7_9PSEU|nr:type VII secretion protein EccB [Goodfellowiella coeruleoviolacea]MCP2170146.1 type VII secretion protein EccB [Goodfellowiella coeruleoviolacea]